MRQTRCKKETRKKEEKRIMQLSERRTEEKGRGMTKKEEKR